MPLFFAPVTLQTTLEQRGERIFRKKDEILFRRGDEAFGTFVVLSGKVTLDFGVDSPLSRAYGPGALVGLPATLTRRTYRMTATVVEDAEFSFWSFTALNTLLRKHRDFCQQLLTILGERMAESQAVAKALAYGERSSLQRSVVV